MWSLSPAETEALLLSLKVAFWSVAASLPVSIALFVLEAAFRSGGTIEVYAFKE